MRKVLNLMSLLVIGCPSVTLSTIGCTCNCSTTQRLTQYANIADAKPTVMGFDDNGSLYVATQGSMIYKINSNQETKEYVEFENEILLNLIVMADGTLYCSTDNQSTTLPNKIYKITSDAKVSDVAQIPAGQGPAKHFVFDTNGNLYFINDTTYVYQVKPGEVTPEQYANIQGAPLNFLAVDSKNLVYAAVAGGFIYKIIDATSFSIFSSVIGEKFGKIFFDNSDNLYALTANQNIYKITTAGVANKYATFSYQVTARDGVTDNNNLYLTTENPILYKITSDGKISQLAIIPDATAVSLAWNKSQNLYCCADNGIIYQVVLS